MSCDCPDLDLPAQHWYEREHPAAEPSEFAVCVATGVLHPRRTPQPAIDRAKLFLQSCFTMLRSCFVEVGLINLWLVILFAGLRSVVRCSFLVQCM